MEFAAIDFRDLLISYFVLNKKKVSCIDFSVTPHANAKLMPDYKYMYIDGALS